MKIIKRTFIISLVLIFSINFLSYANAVDCVPSWNWDWVVEWDCTYPSWWYKVYGNIIVWDKTVTIPNWVTIGIDLSVNRITFTTGKILLQGSAKIDNSVSSRKVVMITYTTWVANYTTPCPAWMVVLNSTWTWPLSGIEWMPAWTWIIYCWKS